jgi:ribosomal protein S18 acetylase RimI-like enzyme
VTATLRPATIADAPALAALWHACELTRPWNDPSADLERALGYAGSTVLLAESGAAVIGSVMTGYDGHRGWLYYLAVDPARRGEGLARKLVEAACTFLEDLGCPKAELMVRTGNPAATLYPHLGWEPQGAEVWGRWLGTGGPV